MDCKHELTAQYLESKKTIMFGCPKCNIARSLGDVVILTKAHHQLTQDVIEAGEELVMLVDDIVSGDYKADSFTAQPMRNALDALKVLPGKDKADE